MQHWNNFNWILRHDIGLVLEVAFQYKEAFGLIAKAHNT